VKKPLLITGLIAAALGTLAARQPAADAAAGHRPAPAPRAAVRIALVSDTHTNRSTEPDQSRYKTHLTRAIADVNAANVDVVLVAGDLTQSGRPEQMGDFSAQARGFRPGVYVVPGNHDIGEKRLPSKPGGGVTSARVRAYEKKFGRSWWTKNVKGIRIIGLNASILGSGLPEEEAQWRFLEDELIRFDAPPTLLLMHYPPFTTAVREPGGVYWNIEPGARSRLLSLVDQPTSGVIGFLTGHLHRGNDTVFPSSHGPVRIVTTPPVSFGLPAGKQPEGWTLVTVTPAGTVESEFRPIQSIPLPAPAPAKP
jgi:3',5'-cyclic AMP phosphodiesterase CpdA